jgi:hypothetical protein
MTHTSEPTVRRLLRLFAFLLVLAACSSQSSTVAERDEDEGSDDDAVEVADNATEDIESPDSAGVEIPADWTRPPELSEVVDQSAAVHRTQKLARQSSLTDAIGHVLISLGEIRTPRLRVLTQRLQLF